MSPSLVLVSTPPLTLTIEILPSDVDAITEPRTSETLTSPSLVLHRWSRLKPFTAMLPSEVLRLHAVSRGSWSLKLTTILSRQSVQPNSFLYFTTMLRLPPDC